MTKLSSNSTVPQFTLCPSHAEHVFLQGLFLPQSALHA